MAAHARANGRAATLVRQHPARSLRLLWAAEQLPRIERVASGGPAHLVPLPPAAQSEAPEPHLGPLQSDARALSPTTASDHSPLGGADAMTRVTLGKSRVRESRTPGSVRAKAEWLSYSTTTGGRCGIWGARRLMCRNIKTLHNFKPPATDDELRASSLQFVRKLSGFTKPSKANEVAFNRAVDQVAQAAHELLEALVTNAPPRDRVTEAAKARTRTAERFRSAPAEPAL